MKYLPPELLLDIFSRAVPASPCLVPLEWNERKQSLSSFMLVTKSWTSAAQEVLFTEVRVQQGIYRHEPRWKVEPAVTKSLQQRTPKWLTFTGNIRDLISLKDEQLSWGGTKRLACADTRGSLFDLHAKYRDLETLVCGGGQYRVNKPIPSLAFVNLRRLVLGPGAAIYGEVPDCQRGFSSSNMPHLRHLSLDVDALPGKDADQALAGILPQITSLAILDRNKGNGPGRNLIKLLHLSPNLVHLSIMLRATHFEVGAFAKAIANVQLRSLHFQAQMLLDESGALYYEASDFYREALALANQQTATIGIARIVAYGRDYRVGCLARSARKTMRFDVFERGNGPSPPFADFDGR